MLATSKRIGFTVDEYFRMSEAGVFDGMHPAWGRADSCASPSTTTESPLAASRIESFGCADDVGALGAKLAHRRVVVGQDEQLHCASRYFMRSTRKARKPSME